MTREQAIEKIKKLLALKDGASKIDSEGEAGQAAKAIDRLQKKFGITMEEVYGSTTSSNDEPTEESPRQSATAYSYDAKQQTQRQNDYNESSSHNTNFISELFENDPNAPKVCLVLIASAVVLIICIVGSRLGPDNNTKVKSPKQTERTEYRESESYSPQDYSSEVEQRTRNYNSERGRTSNVSIPDELSNEDKANIKHVIKDWNLLHSPKYGYGNLSQLYNSTISFYGQTLSADKADHMAMDAVYESDFIQECRNIILSLLDNGDVRLDFTKKVYTNEGTNSYPSYLILKRSSRNRYGWSIIKESDKITDRNLHLE